MCCLQSVSDETRRTHQLQLQLKCKRFFSNSNTRPRSTPYPCPSLVVQHKPLLILNALHLFHAYDSHLFPRTLTHHDSDTSECRRCVMLSFFGETLPPSTSQVLLFAWRQLLLILIHTLTSRFHHQDLSCCDNCTRNTAAAGSRRARGLTASDTESQRDFGVEARLLLGLVHAANGAFGLVYHLHVIVVLTQLCCL